MGGSARECSLPNYPKLIVSDRQQRRLGQHRRRPGADPTPSACDALCWVIADARPNLRFATILPVNSGMSQEQHQQPTGSVHLGPAVPAPGGSFRVLAPPSDLPVLV